MVKKVKKIVLLFFGFFYLFANEIKDIDLIKLDKECNEKNLAKSCVKLASVLYVVGKENLDSFFVQNYHKKACDIGGLYSEIGCYQIATTYNIKAFEKNTQNREYYVYMAKKYYKKACEKTNDKSCKMLNPKATN